jgi:hypothetical protein
VNLRRFRPSAGRAPPRIPKYSRKRLACSLGGRSSVLSQSRPKLLGRRLSLSSVGRAGLTSPALRDWPAFGAIGGGAATRWPFVMDRQPYPRSLPRCARALSPHDPGCEKRRSKSPGSKPFHGRSPRSREERQQQSAMHNANLWGVRLAEVSGICSLSAGCPHLPGRLSGPALACMRECAHFMKAEEPRNLRYM